MPTDVLQEANPSQALPTPEHPPAGAPASRRFRRRRYWVDMSSQLPITLLAVGAALSFVVMFNAVLLDLTNARREQIVASVPAMDERLRQEDRAFFRSILVLSGIFMVFVTVGTVVLTQRSAGPIRRIQTHLDRMARGDLDHQVTLRSRDHFRPLSETCNILIRTLQAQRRADVIALERLAADADRPISPGDARVLAERLRALAREKQQALGPASPA